MPKQRITKEMVLEAAFELARQGGMEKVQVKSIAEKLGCSVQPVYSYCRNMESLKEELTEYTGTFLRRYLDEHINRQDLFRSTGMAHAAFAREEPFLYRLYFLRERKDVHSIQDIFRQESNERVADTIAGEMSISRENARQLHLHMMIYNIGISFILSTLGKETDPGEVLRLKEEAFHAFSGIYEGEKQ